MDRQLYDMIFKRKSFHLLGSAGQEGLSPTDIERIQAAWQALVPLCPEIRTAIRVVPSRETGCRRGEYCILFYSEKKGNYLHNIGYLGEQMDLYLVAQNIGTLWFGLGKTEEASFEGLEFVIMMAIARVDDEAKFRKDLFKSKRKPVEEMWNGEPIDGVTDLVRFAPSACNLQPWLVEREERRLTVYRYKKPGKWGIIPAGKLTFYNQIDVGIFLCFLDLCLEHHDIPCRRELFRDDGDAAEKTRIAVYTL